MAEIKIEIGVIPFPLTLIKDQIIGLFEMERWIVGASSKALETVEVSIDAGSHNSIKMPDGLGLCSSKLNTMPG
ncbi:hypothetical protein [Mesorhizobium shangrilense]|uniref:Uncharacterized protein n=1 Tax=Mesorhizobium shangrilense TaxID=460060 RepID=A0ABV2DLQ2_9HYPH